MVRLRYHSIGSILFLILFFPVYGWGTTFYVDPTCATPGNGTSQNCTGAATDPFDQWSDVTWTAGNSYLQKRGTTAREMVTIGATGTEGNIITLGAYGTGANPKILGSINKDAAGDWTSTQTLTSGLISQWLLDENPASNGTTLEDVTTTNDATLVTDNGTDNKSVSGKIGTAIGFDGTGDYATAGAVSSFSFIQNTGVFSIAFWMKLTDYTQTNYIMGNTGTSAEKGFWVGWVSGVLRIDILKGTEGTVLISSESSASLIADNNWHHVAITGDATNVVFYVDGVSNAGSSTMITKSSGDSSRVLSIGSVTNAGVYLTGALDDVRIYDRKLTATEAQNLAYPTLWLTAALSATPNIAWRDGVAMTLAASKALIGTDATKWYFGSDSKAYVYGTSNPTIGGHTYEFPQRESCIQGVDKSYVTVDGIDCQYSNSKASTGEAGYGGIYFTGTASAATNVTVQNLTSSYNYSHGINFLKVDDSLVYNCDTNYNGYNWGLVSPANAQGVGIRLEQCNDSTARGNRSAYSLTYNILVYSSVASSGVTVERNTSHDSSQGKVAGSGSTLGAGIGVYGSVSNTTVQRNYSYHDPINNYYITSGATNTMLYYNVGYQDDQGYDWTQNLWIEYSYTQMPSGVTLYNNTFYADTNTRTGWMNIYASSDAGLNSLVMKNNILVYKGNGTGGVYPIYIGNKGTPAPDINYNLVYAPNMTWGAVVGDALTRAQYLAAGYDSTFGSVADPLILSTTNFRLATGSPVINKGVSVGLTQDAELNTVPFGSGVDLGAYENQTGMTLGSGGSLGIGSGGSLTLP